MYWTAPWVIWTGRIVSGLLMLAMLFSGIRKLIRHRSVVEVFIDRFGFPAPMLIGLGVTEMACVILYAAPPTTVLAAILLTGYLGGGISTNIRFGVSPVQPFVLGVMTWAGLFLRDERIRSLLLPFFF